MSIIVYSKPACVQCTATYKALTKHGLDYEVVDLSRDEQALRTVTAMGHLQAPVVVDGDESWSGFRPDLIKQAALRSAA